MTLHRDMIDQTPFQRDAHGHCPRKTSEQLVVVSSAPADPPPVLVEHPTGDQCDSDRFRREPRCILSGLFIAETMDLPWAVDWMDGEPPSLRRSGGREYVRSGQCGDPLGRELSGHGEIGQNRRGLLGHEPLVYSPNHVRRFAFCWRGEPTRILPQRSLVTHREDAITRRNGRRPSG